MEEREGTLLQKYELGKLLGHGNFAKVYHARDMATSQSVAIKIIDKKRIIRAGMMHQIKREISIMRMVRHPHIIHLHHVMATKSKIFFIMDYAKGGELFTLLTRGPLHEHTARKLFHQLILAVHFCHLRGVFHRDLKPENLLLDENGDLKVSDFGLGALAQSAHRDGLLHTACGTPSYVAPEVIRMNGYDGATSDIWSCGVILFVLLAGYLPFRDRNLMELYRKITHAEFSCPAKFSPEARQLLSRILDPDPGTRISMQGIMESPWFNGATAITAITAMMGGGEAAAVKPATAFEIISLAPGLDLSGLFEERRTGPGWFVSTAAPSVVVAKLEEAAVAAGLRARKEAGLVRMEGEVVAVDAEIFEVKAGLLLVEMRVAHGGDLVEFQRLWNLSLCPSLREIISV